MRLDLGTWAVLAQGRCGQNVAQVQLGRIAIDVALLALDAEELPLEPVELVGERGDLLALSLNGRRQRLDPGLSGVSDLGWSVAVPARLHAGNCTAAGGLND